MMYNLSSDFVLRMSYLVNLKKEDLTMKYNTQRFSDNLLSAI